MFKALSILNNKFVYYIQKTKHIKQINLFIMLEILNILNITFLTRFFYIYITMIVFLNKSFVFNLCNN